jgi:hypothetical protein
MEKSVQEHGTDPIACGVNAGSTCRFTQLIAAARHQRTKKLTDFPGAHVDNVQEMKLLFGLAGQRDEACRAGPRK